MTIPCHIRAYRSNDCEALAAIFAAAINAIDDTLYSPRQKQVWRQLDLNPAVAVSIWQGKFAANPPRVAVTNQDKPMGFMAVAPQQDYLGSSCAMTAYLDLLYVHPQFQGQGVAQCLYDEAVAELLAQGIKVIYVHASKVAQPFFSKQGFNTLKQEVVERHGIALPRYLMKQTLY